MAVAVSGGADSVALFRLLLALRSELGDVISVAHFNHRLRGEESEADQAFVGNLAKSHQVEFRYESGDAAAHAKETRAGIEAAARDLRYQFFHRLLREGRVDHIATAHTLDDQAETVLLKVTRGAGTRGLAGIYPEIKFGPSGAGRNSRTPSIIRPLLGIRRAELETFLNTIGQDWREDSSNRDLRHTRNRVRHGLMPRLERNLNPAVREALAETAEIARAEEEYWQAELDRILPTLWKDQKLGVSSLIQLPLALQRRVVRAAAESLGLRLEFGHVEEVLAVALGEQPASANLPNQWTVSRKAGSLHFSPKSPATKPDYEYALPVPGAVDVPEANTRFEARLVSAKPGYNPEHLLDPALLPKELLVRNWRPGDRFWPAHSKSPKKIKELLQERQISGSERALWPVVANGTDVVWLRGFSANTRWLLPRGAEQGLLLQEVPRTASPPGPSPLQGVKSI